MASNINEMEKLVLDVIEEYLGKNRFFNVNEIVPFINSRFAKKSVNINNEGIRLILNSLANKNFIAEGSKLTKQKILNNPNRKKIYNFILENPGISFNQIVNELDLTPPVVAWHMNTLLKFGCIKKKKINSHEALYHINFEFEIEEIVHFLSREKCKIIVEYLLENDEGLSKLEISNELKLSRNTVKKYIEKLEEFDLVHTKRSSNKTLYFLNSDYYKELIIETR
ncbi:MAG: winged helix-turn-helix transcriptional regulator [Promethearchaeota archaeon]